MADESHVVRGINWRETFPFTNLFRSFRIAIHPSKLVLGLLALLSLYVGGRILDAVWHRQDLAVPGELVAYQSHSDRLEGKSFAEVRREKREEVEQGYASKLLAFGIETDPAKAIEAARKGEKEGELVKKVHERHQKNLTDLNTERDEARKVADALSDASEKDKAHKAIDKEYAASRRNIWDGYIAELNAIDAINGNGIFIEFFEYEVSQVDGVVIGVLEWNWLGGAGETSSGVVPSIVRFFTVGPVWLLCEHTVYAILFAILFLLVWSVFGGAIARIAAVHVARDEKISVRQALRFSIGKLLSFVFAPIIPLLIVLGLGLVVSLVALIGNIGYVGPILVGAAFFLALVAGFVMALVMMGTAGGFNLMYPTIAVEGSDSFDAISRSFSYVYARPWRMLFYTAVAIVYGALTYLFVRLFVWLMFILTHAFISLGMMRKAEDGRELWDALWPSPASPWKLTYDIPWAMFDWGQATGAWLLSFWNYLTIAMVGAFAISFYFSANTVIYYLMRHEVDATELDDVFLEQSEEEIVETVTVTTTVTDAPAAPANADAPPSEGTPPAQV
jgi:hypothetical protein